MIEARTDMPDGVIGFTLSGKLHASDYRDVLLPAIEQAAKSGDVRVVIVFDDFDGLSGGALWADCVFSTMTRRPPLILTRWRERKLWLSGEMSSRLAIRLLPRPGHLAT